MCEDRRPWGRLDQLETGLAFAIETPHLAGVMFRMNATPVLRMVASEPDPSQFPDISRFWGFCRLG